MKFFRSEIFEQGSALPRYNVDLVKLKPIFYWLKITMMLTGDDNFHMLVTDSISYKFQQRKESCHQHCHRMCQIEINPWVSISIKKIVGEMGKLLDKKKCMRLTGNHEQNTLFIIQHFVGHNLNDLSLRTFWFFARWSFDLFQFTC